LNKTELTISKVAELYREFGTDLKHVRTELARVYKERESSRDRALVRVGDTLLPYLPDSLLRSLRGVDRAIRRTTPSLRASFDDVEAEVTYLLIRSSRPEVVVEISPSGGWSSLWMLSALKDNGTGHLYSYDLVDDATKNIPLALSTGRWTFVRGDVRQAVRNLPRPIDYLFIDSDHSAEFADWYIQNVFPLLARNAIVSVDDVFRAPDDRPRQFGEGQRVLHWLGANGVDFLSFSPYSYSGNYEEAMRIKSQLEIDRPIHTSIVNPCTFFSYSGAQSGAG
jgi:predicted O-methyltransferase YrrM